MEGKSQDNPIEEQRKQAMERLAGHSFVTEKGSKYTYDEEGRTVRHKLTSGETLEPQDVTVFVDFDDEEGQKVNDSIHSENPELKRKIYVIERGEDNQPKVIRNFSDVENPDNLYLGLFKDGKMVGSKKATLKPTMGNTVFDTRHFQDESGEWQTERHLGHKVIDIE